eukprot:GHVR01162173.1.p1 GENE.GHVR01162173.1~~GHVR01162173.1.p1  ORF type:complete len:203 (-),score=21.69 GHVR01162173.1:161-769(-)
MCLETRKCSALTRLEEEAEEGGHGPSWVQEQLEQEVMRFRTEDGRRKGGKRATPILESIFLCTSAPAPQTPKSNAVRPKREASLPSSATPTGRDGEATSNAQASSSNKGKKRTSAVPSSSSDSSAQYSSGDEAPPTAYAATESASCPDTRGFEPLFVQEQRAKLDYALLQLRSLSVVHHDCEYCKDLIREAMAAIQDVSRPL